MFSLFRIEESPDYVFQHKPGPNLYLTIGILPP